MHSVGFPRYVSRGPDYQVPGLLLWDPIVHVETEFVCAGLRLLQVVQALCIAASGTLNTHVLMALAAFGTLYLGLPQEVGAHSRGALGACE
jgi:hypothetical protein